MSRILRLIAAAGIVAALTVSLGYSQQIDSSKPLTLSACIREALARNLDLSIEAVNPALNEAALAETKEKYLPSFGLGYIRQDTTVLGTWGVEGTSISQKYDYASAELKQNIVTGGEISLSLSNSMSDTSRIYTVINPSYYSMIRFDLVQPLLKGFGPKVNSVEIFRAKNTLDSSQAELKAAVLRIVYEVEEAYWNLIYAVENLKVQDAFLAQSRETLERNSEAARIGTKSAIEVLSSETETARWEDAVIAGRLQVQRCEERLLRLMDAGTADTSGESGAIPAETRLVLADRPAAEARAVGIEEALRAALAERPEIVVAEKELAANVNDVGYYRNQLLPELDLNFSIWNPGQSGVKVLYLNDDVFTKTVIGRIEGSRLDSLKEIFRKTYRNWSFGLNLTVPLANVFSRASLAKASLTRRQSEMKLERQKKTIASEVSEAINALRMTERKIKSSAGFRAMVEKRLAAEKQRYDLGLVGSEWLFSYQRDLAQAKTDEVKALVDYKIAVAKLDKVMGMTLKSKGLKFRDFDF